MPWFRTASPSECSGAGDRKTLRDTFEIQFITAGAPSAMAIFDEGLATANSNFSPMSRMG